MNQRKSLKELNLLDKFLFDEAMDDPENVKTMLDIILSQNTNRKHPELVSTELIELLKYMERSTDEVSGECKSKRIQEMHRRVCQIKASEKTEVKYMQSWEEKILIKQEGIAEGILEKGVLGVYMPEFDLNCNLDDYFKSKEWIQIIQKWEGYVRKVVDNKGKPPMLY